MRLSTIAIAFALALPAAALARDATPGTAIVPLRQVVPYMEARYQGEVTEIALDSSGDKAPHYHVQMRLGDRTVALDVNATTLDLTARQEAQPGPGWASISTVAAQAAKRLNGRVLTAELDGSDAAAPHYHVDVRLQTGKTARLKIDPATQQIGWRTPPIAD